MAVNKVIYGGKTLIDLSSDTLAAANSLLSGVTAHTKSGKKITGTNKGYSVGYQKGYDAVVNETAPILVQGFMPTITMASRYGGSYAYALDNYDKVSPDIEDMYSCSWKVSDYFAYSIMDSSSACTISVSNYDTNWSLEVYIKIVCKYTNLSGEQTQETFYKLYYLGADEDYSDNINCEGSNWQWTWSIEGIRWYY